SPSRTTAQVGAYRGGRRRPVRVFRQYTSSRVDEIGIPPDQRRSHAAAAGDVAGSAGGRNRRDGESPSDDPEQGRGGGQPARVSDLPVVVQHLHATLCEGVEDGWA